MSDIVVERSGGIVVLTLNRPERKNAVTRAMWPRLRDVFLEVSDRSDDRVLIITGAGDSFCSGGDLADTSDAEQPEGDSETALGRMRVVESAALALHECSKPTIAAINGVAAGGGLNLALGCDLTVLSEDARLSQIFVRRGLVPDFGALWLLPRLIGLHRAKELMLLGETITAAQAADLGLVNRLVPRDEVLTTAQELATRLAALPTTSLSIIKRGLNRSFESSMQGILEYEAVSQTLAATSASYIAARTDFVGPGRG